MIDELINDRLRRLPPEYSAFVMGEVPEKIVTTLAPVDGLNEAQMTVAENALRLYLMFIFSASEMDQFIAEECELPPDQAAVLSAGLRQALPEDIRTLLKVVEQQLKDSPTANDLASEIAQTEAALGQIANLRTRQSDAEEPVYTSTQAAILTESRSGVVTGVPPPPPLPATTEPPRWSSGQ